MTAETVPDAVFAHDVYDRLMDLALSFGSANFGSALHSNPERRAVAERQADDALQALGREMRAALL